MVKWFQLSAIFVTGYSGETPIVSIKEDNVEMSRETAVINMTVGSFFHDIANELIYIFPFASDNPNSNGKTYVFYVLLGFCDTRADYGIQGESSIFYIPAIDSKNAPPFTQSLTEIFTGDITSAFGEIKLQCPEWFYANIENYIWINSEARVLVGELDALYNTYSIILYGLISKIIFSDEGALLSLIDIRDRLYTTIPPDRFLVADFPYLDPEIHFNTRAVLVGEKWGITPNLVNTASYTYEISQVEFSFKIFAGIQAIDAVYRDGVLLSTPGDYSVDLANAQFSLTASPGASIITCDAKGLKISRNFTTLAWNDTYSQNIADITYFYLRLQGITDAYIDETEFATLQTNKSGVECGDWLSQEIDFKEKIKELQMTGHFHLLPTTDGRIGIIPYSFTDIPSVQLTNEYYTDFQISRDAEGILNRVLLRYDRLPEKNTTETEGGESLGDYRYFRRVDNSTAYKYQAIQMRNFKTIINNEGDAENDANTAMSLYNKPPELVIFNINHEAIAWQLLKKIGITFTRIIESQVTTIYDQAPFILIGKVINWNGFIQLTLRKDPAATQGEYLIDHDDEILLDQDDEGLQD